MEKKQKTKKIKRGKTELAEMKWNELHHMSHTAMKDHMLHMLLP